MGLFVLWGGKKKKKRARKGNWDVFDTQEEKLHELHLIYIF